MADIVKLTNDIIHFKVQKNNCWVIDYKANGVKHLKD